MDLPARSTFLLRVRPLRWIVLGSLAPVVLAASLFAWTALDPAWRTPESGTTAELPRLPPTRSSLPELVLCAWNLEKVRFFSDGRFRHPDDVRVQLERIAAFLRKERVDVAFLSEVVFACDPAPFNQVEFLAREAGFHAWAYGDNYRFGFPFLRIRSGNAILSRLPLEALRVDELPGSARFWNPRNQRRLLWARLSIGGERLLCGSVRNDSFDLANNALQVESILQGLPDEPVVLGGDFNATPSDRSFELLEASGRFSGVFHGDATFPAQVPRRRIDTVLVPRGWHVVAERVADVNLSDHEPVLVEVRLPTVGDGG